MHRRITISRTAFAVFLGLAVAGCERAQELTGPVAEPTVEAVASVHGPGSSGFRIVPRASGVPWSGNATSDRVSPGMGATLSLDGAVLVVPAGAVRTATIFTMVKVETSDGFHVELGATSVGSFRYNDVGAAGFKKPVKLTLSYSGADLDSLGDIDPSRFQIAWLKSATELQPVGGTVDTGAESVTAGLRHFSGYIIVAN